jgi:hypothetical protein
MHRNPNVAPPPRDSSKYRRNAASAAILRCFGRGISSELLEENPDHTFDALTVDPPGTRVHDTHLSAEKTGDEGIVFTTHIADTSIIAKACTSEVKELIFSRPDTPSKPLPKAVIEACYSCGKIPTISVTHEVSKSGRISAPIFRRTTTRTKFRTCNWANSLFYHAAENPNLDPSILAYIQLADLLEKSLKNRKNSKTCDPTRRGEYVFQITNRLAASAFRDIFEKEGIMELSRSTLRPDNTRLARHRLALGSTDPERILPITPPLRDPIALINQANFDAAHFDGNPLIFTEQELAPYV